jgi:hypothetical protein
VISCKKTPKQSSKKRKRQSGASSSLTNRISKKAKSSDIPASSNKLVKRAGNTASVTRAESPSAPEALRRAESPISNDIPRSNRPKTRANPVGDIEPGISTERHKSVDKDPRPSVPASPPRRKRTTRTADGLTPVNPVSQAGLASQINNESSQNEKAEDGGAQNEVQNGMSMEPARTRAKRNTRSNKDATRDQSARATRSASARSERSTRSQGRTSRTRPVRVARAGQSVGQNTIDAIDEEDAIGKVEDDVNNGVVVDEDAKDDEFEEGNEGNEPPETELAGATGNEAVTEEMGAIIGDLEDVDQAERDDEDQSDGMDDRRAMIARDIINRK